MKTRIPWPAACGVPWGLPAARQAAAEALRIANDVDRADEAKIIEDLKTKMTIYSPSADELKRWEEAGKGIWPKFQDKIDRKVMDRVLAVQN